MKNKILLLAVLCSTYFSNNIAAQQKTSSKVKVQTKTTTPDKVYAFAEQMPAFPGGETAIANYFKKALAAYTFKSGGTINLTMVINKTGQPENLEIGTGINKETDSLVLAAAGKMPKWQPGKNNGQPVKVRMNIPVTIISIAQEEENRKNDDLIFVSVQQQPTFPGGEKSMMEYLIANIKYPAEAKAKKIEGTVVIQFVIWRNGEIKDARILKGLSPEIDAEALRVISSMPNWSPGKQNGRAVNVRYNIPVYFKYNTPEENE